MKLRHGVAAFAAAAVATYTAIGVRMYRDDKKHEQYMMKMNDIHDLSVSLREWIVAASNDPSVSADDIKKRYEEDLAFIELIANSF